MSGDAPPAASTGGQPGAPATADPAPPALRVVRGYPTDDEVAAVIAVIVARYSAGARPRTPGGASGPVGDRSRWNAPGGLVRPSLTPGGGAWAASGRLFGVRTSAGW